MKIINLKSSENDQKCIKEVKTTKNAKKCKIKIEL
jgi:hypothetical protein